MKEKNNVTFPWEIREQDPCFILEDPNFILRENYIWCSGLASGTKFTILEKMHAKK